MTERPGGDLGPEDVPGYGHDLNAFANRFDGYQHFRGSEAAMAENNAIRAQWSQTGVLPASIDDLRACLFVEARRERFVEFDHPS